MAGPLSGVTNVWGTFVRGGKTMGELFVRPSK